MSTSSSHSLPEYKKKKQEIFQNQVQQSGATSCLSPVTSSAFQAHLWLPAVASTWPGRLEAVPTSLSLLGQPFPRLLLSVGGEHTTSIAKFVTATASSSN
jgi:hypothetical protein